MNNQELIEYCESLKGDLNKFINGIDVNKIIAKIEQLDEPKEKVTLPRPVANWISCVKGRNKTLLFALENAPIEVNLWFCEDEKEYFNGGIEFIWEGKTPEIDEEVLVYNPSTQSIYTDIWVDYGEGIGFEDTDEDTVFWMSYPKPPKEKEEE